MIHSSLFSHDDSPVWNPKTSGQFLHISDDQLQILSNLPDWSKVINKDSTNRGLTKESSILISQSSEVESQILGIGNSEIQQGTKNIELFDKNQQCRKKILKTLELNTRKRNKSSSLIEIGKHNKDLSSWSTLKRASSASNIHIQNFLPKEICHKFNITDKETLHITYPASTVSQNRSKDIFTNTVEVDSLKLLDENLGIEDFKSNKTASCNLKQSCEDMEVIAQQPTNTNALKANMSDVEIIEITQEKQDKLSTYAEPEKLGIEDFNSNKTTSCNLKQSCEDMEVIAQQPTITNAFKANMSDVEIIEITQDKSSTYAEPEKLSNLQSDNQICNGSVNEKKSNHVSVSDSNKEEARSIIMEEKQDLFSIDAAHIKFCSLHSDEVISSEYENDKEQTDQVSSISSEQVVEVFLEIKSDSDIKALVPENNVSNGNQECINLNPEKIEKSEIAKDIPGQQSLSEKNSCGIVNIQNSSKFTQAIDVSNTLPDKLPTSEKPVTFKRKAESKKSSKKRKYIQEKKEELDVRSLKKTGDITYSSEDIEILLDLIKQFL